MRKYALSLLGIALLSMIAACSEHYEDEKYRSLVPYFADIVCSQDEIHVGDKVTFTAVQRTKGRWLDKTEYTWTSTPFGTAQHKASVPDGGIYDGKDPTCETIFTTPGSHRITFKGDYRGSGNVIYMDKSESLPSGIEARYTANVSTGGSNNLNYLHAEVKKTFTVLP